MDMRSADTNLIRGAEKRMPETPNEGVDLTEEEWVVYSALLATDTDMYLGQSADLVRRAKAVVGLLAGVPLTLPSVQR